MMRFFLKIGFQKYNIFSGFDYFDVKKHCYKKYKRVPILIGVTLQKIMSSSILFFFSDLPFITHHIF